MDGQRKKEERLNAKLIIVPSVEALGTTQAELRSSCEAETSAELHIQVAAICERLPSAVRGDSGFRDACQEQCSGTTSAEGVPSVGTGITVESSPD
jgi:hypothetical protein